MRHLFAVAPGLAVLLVTSPAYAGTAPRPIPEDNSPWVGVIAVLVFVAVVGGMLYIANAYRKSNQVRERGDRLS